jgi:hypothetical protein
MRRSSSRGIPQTKLLGTAVKLLAPVFGSRRFEVSGRLLPEGDHGVGLALSLSGNHGRTSDSVALWEAAYDTAPGGDGATRFFRLAQPTFRSTASFALDFRLGVGNHLRGSAVAPWRQRRDSGRNRGER